MRTLIIAAAMAALAITTTPASAGWDGGPWECDGGLTVELIKTGSDTTQILIEGPIAFGRAVPPSNRGEWVFPAAGLNLKFKWVTYGEELVPLLNGKRCRKSGNE
jgi:hypothetical protein